jgi:hypothetical protein
VEFHPDKEKICAHAVERGKKFVNLAEHSYKEVSGAAMREKMNSAWETRQFKFSVNGSSCFSVHSLTIDVDARAGDDRSSCVPSF